jgi:hypothetical protein
MKIKKAVWFILHGHCTLPPLKPYHTKANMFIHNREAVLRHSTQMHKCSEELWGFLM